MTDLMFLLYEYAQSNRVAGFIDCRTYREVERLEEKCLAALRKDLSPRQLESLDRYLDAFMEQQGMDLEATFLAGFSIAWELRV